MGFVLHEKNSLNYRCLSYMKIEDIAHFNPQTFNHLQTNVKRYMKRTGYIFSYEKCFNGGFFIRREE